MIFFYFYLNELYKLIYNFLESFLSYFIDFKPKECDSFDINEFKTRFTNAITNLLYSTSESKNKFENHIKNEETCHPCINLDNLAFSGGGAKGVTYPGAYRALKESGIIEKVKQISGASAGSIISAFIATGMPIERFRQEIASTKFKSLLGNTLDFSFNSPGTIRFVTRSGEPLYKFIKININKSINDYISTDDFDCISKWSKKISDDDYAYLLKLKDKLINQDIETLKITFKDLMILNKLFPEKFKNIYINAVKHPTGEVQLFNHFDTPDVEIALAARASSAIPGLIQPAEIEINGEVNRYIDGSVYDNIPVDCFDCELHNQKTLLFSFGEGLDNERNWTHHALYGSYDDEENNNEIFKPKFLMKLIRNIPSILGIIALPYSLDERKDAGLKNIRKKFRLRTIELKVANISVTDFDYAEKVATVMDALGYIDTMNYIINHNEYDLFAKGAYPEFYNDLFNIFNTAFEFTLKNPYLCISKKDQRFIKSLDINTYNFRELIYKIKEYTENNLESSVAFLLAKSVELISNLININKFQEDITEFTRRFNYPETKPKTIIACN